ncbi:MAG: PilZ domain-containing protein [Hyphomicrobium sp.]|nr:PilZ domain-containing protein [Hyphomicrobium sp.]
MFADEQTSSSSRSRGERPKADTRGVNLSAAGACVRAANGANLPHDFALRIQLERVDERCEVMWRRGRDCGVRFKK